MANGKKRRSTRKRVKVTRRNLSYAWIELGHTADARAFSAGAKRARFLNLFVRESPLRIVKDNMGERWEDPQHPLVPIRTLRNTTVNKDTKKRSTIKTILALPSASQETKNGPVFIKDPLFVSYKKNHGEDKFQDDYNKQLDDLTSWAFSPGITNGKGLTTDAGSDRFADMIFLSGHQAGGVVYGGDSQMGLHLGKALAAGVSTNPKNTLRYVIIPGCGACGESMMNSNYLPLFRRDNPIHGILGYNGTYQGEKKGPKILAKFAANLAKLSNTMTVLEAWRQAQDNYHKDTWGAVMHQSSMNDTTYDWLGGKLSRPNPKDKIVELTESSLARGGDEVKPPEYDHFVNFVIDGTKIDSTNTFDRKIGLFSGDKGHIELTKKDGKFLPGDKITIMFVYIRTKKELVLDKIMRIPAGNRPEGTITLKNDLNKANKATGLDGLTFTFSKAVSSVDIPVEILSMAHDYKATGFVKRQGTTEYGKVSFQLNANNESFEYGLFLFPEDHQMDGAYLRGPRPKP